MSRPRVRTRGRLELEALEDRVLLSNYTVTTTADSGAGSLRQGIADAPGVIDFNIPTTDPGYSASTGVFTIEPVSALPQITVPVVIDGTSQPGYAAAGHPLIEINGSKAGGKADGLDITAGNSTIEGLAIDHFSQNGILIASANNTIGGATSGSANVISGNTKAGVQIDGNATTGNVLQGNFIGTDATGATAVVNGIDINVSGGSSNNSIVGNVQPSSGSWTELSHVSGNGLGTMLMLSDGTVMVQEESISNTWYQLTPDALGSYLDGTWTNAASMNTPRYAYGSVVLTNGDVLVYGGEYTNPNNPNTASYINSGEIYDPTTNTWTKIASIPKSLDPQNQFGDDCLETLPNGNVLGGYIDGTQTFIYNPSSNSWSAGPTKIDPGVAEFVESSDEENWVKLPGSDGNILDYELWASLDQSPGYAEYLDTATNKWVATGRVPVPLSNDDEEELGPAILLPNGDVFQTGANGTFGGTKTNTALYDPSTNTWAAGPTIPGGLTADDAPAAVLPDGNVIFAADSSTETDDDTQYAPPTKIFEYNPVTNTITPLTLPPALNSELSTDSASNCYMLVLPTGEIAFVDDTNNLWLYSEPGTVNSAWDPTVTSVTSNGGNSYTLTGTQLNGLEEGASYGDDAGMSENYPLVQITDAAGAVSYARTFNWSSTAVATGNASETTQFSLPPGVGSGPLQLRVVTNGIASAPFSTGDLVTTNPSNETVFAGQTATFTAASSNPADTVQWQVSTDGTNFSDILGANSTTYSFTAADDQNGSEYRAVFSGTLMTSAATLTVNQVTTNPANETVGAGLRASFTAAVDDFPSATAQWQLSTNKGKTFSNLAGATSDTLTFATALTQNGYQYRAVFSDADGTATTTAATLTVILVRAPVFTSANHFTMIVGATSSFNVAATGTPVPALREAGLLPSGLGFTDNQNGTATLTGQPAAGTAGTYHLVFLAFNGDSLTQSFTLTINQAPVIILQPSSKTVLAGQRVTFTATASANPTATVQWQVSTNHGATFSNLKGATSASLTLTASAAMNDYEYQAIFTNSLGKAMTNTVTLTVDSAPAFTSANHATFITGKAESFMVVATGFPIATLSNLFDSLPLGLMFTDNQNGTATLSGTPATGTSGTYTLVFLASNTINTVFQIFTLKID